MSPREILPQSAAVAACAARIDAASAIAELAACVRQARALAATLQRGQAGAAVACTVLSRLNDAVTERVLALLADRFRLPVARWCWLGLGSEGRLEQTLATDQDNGLVFSAADDGEARELRELFLPFARAANQALAECGFPLCDGEVMAGNPRWCLSIAEWLEHFGAWVRTPEPDALLNAAIFFDFRALAGDATLASEMRAGLGELTRGNTIFLRMMTANALAAPPPLGRLRDFDLGAGSGGAIDLKKFGSRIFVDAARILSLGAAVAESGTADRLRAVAAEGVVSREDAAAWIRAFYAVQGIRLDAQAVAEGMPGNLIAPSQLNDFDRRILLEALRQARNMQALLRSRYQIET